MKILAIDTSNRPLSVALLDDEELLLSKTTNIARNHSVMLMPTIAELLDDSHLEAKDIDRIVVAEGPGSYTGLRIGVTAAKTLAAILNKELVGVSSLKLIAANIFPQKDVLVVPFFDARNQNVFSGVYEWKHDYLENILKDQHISFEILTSQLAAMDKKKIFVGPLKEEFVEIATDNLEKESFEFANTNYQLPQAAILGRLGRRESPVDSDTFVPKYRRLTQAELQWMKKHPEEKNNHGKYVEKI